MSSQSLKFRVGERVRFPQLVCNDHGKHEVIKADWQVEAIFPVSRLAIISKMNCNQGSSAQVSLDKLAAYN